MIPSRIAVLSLDPRDWSVRGKLWLGFGLLILFMALGGTVAYRQILHIEKAVIQVVQVEEPLEQAILEMEINAGETARAVLDYVHDLEPEDIDRVRDSEADFERFAAEFDRLAETGEERRLGRLVAERYSEFKGLGDEIIALADRRRDALETFRKNVREIDDLIDEKLQVSIDRTAPDAITKLEAALEMEVNIDEAFAAIEGYIAHADPALRQEVLDAEADFERFEALYRRTNPSPDEETWLDRIDRDFANTVEAGNRIIAATDSLNERLGKFEADLYAMDTILDDRIQPLIHAETLRAAEGAKTATNTAALLFLALGAVTVAIGSALAWALSRGIIEPVGILARGAEIVGGGNLEHRIDIAGNDEFAKLSGAFNRMAENLGRDVAARERAEERSRDMAEVASDWFWEMDENLRFSYFSERFGTVTGVDPIHVLGKTRAEAGKGDPGEKKWRDHLADLEAHRPFRDFRYKFYSPDGRTLHLRISGRPAFDADGVFRGYRGVGTDITSRRRAEMALRESEERLRAVIDSMVIGVITIDEQGVVQSFSPGAEHMFGYALDEVLGKNVNMLMPEPRRSGHDGYIANYLNTGEAKIIGKGRLLDGRCKDGSAFPMELDISEMMVGGRRLFSGVVRDITVRKQAEDALRESEARFRGAIESLHEGFALYDAEGRLVICNAAYGELHSGIEELLVPGARFEDLLNASVERGLLAGAVGREEEFIRERLEQHRNPKGSVERELTDGRWFIITEGRTPDGGTYAALRDITALKQREAALRESEERFRAVVNHSPAKIHIKDALVHRLIRSVHEDMKSTNVFKLLESVRVNHSSVSVH